MGLFGKRIGGENYYNKITISKKKSIFHFTVFHLLQWEVHWSHVACQTGKCKGNGCISMRL